MLPLVSIHAPVWVRPPYLVFTRMSIWFQFTHPCGCDGVFQIWLMALTGFNSRTRVGATSLDHVRRCKSLVSIHAPVWVRPMDNGDIKDTDQFQFTHPCGCDDYGVTFTPEEAVSIHAPVWVRLSARLLESWKDWFQFTHPCGCDFDSGRRLSSCSGFNSRTRVGATTMNTDKTYNVRVSIHAPVWVRLANERHMIELYRFQFTHPCGCDLMPLPRYAGI